MKQITEIDDPRLVKGLAHPLRVQILRVLETRVASPSEISEELDAPLGNVSYHVRFLARVGLIELARTRPRRGAVEHYYRSVGRVRVTDKAWAQVPEVVKSSLVGSTIDQIGRSVGAAASTGGFNRSDAILSRRSHMLDSRGFTELAALQRQLLDRAAEIERESADRLSAAGQDGEIASGLVLMLYESSDDAAPASPPRRSPGRRRTVKS